MSVTFTPEQFNIKEHVAHLDGIVLVSAGAGTGKSFMAVQVVAALDPKNVLYTAFNKAIVVEAREKFNNPAVECKTLHALAYRYTSPKGEIRATNYRDLPKDLSYSLKYTVLQALEQFFVSDSSDMFVYFEDYFKEEKQCQLHVFTAITVVEGMLAKEVPWSFSFMLKYFHLMLIEDPYVCIYDLVILDEINDTTAVALEIFKLIKAPKKLGLGEPHQAIYGFMHLVNGFDILKDVPLFPLTNSFRCSKEIAYSIQTFMQKEVTEDFTFVGTDNPVDNGKSLYCTLTNASIIKELVNRLDVKKSFILLRKPVDIFACSLAVLSASTGKEVYQTQYKYLHDVYSDWFNSDKKHKTFFAYVMEELQDSEVHSAVRLLVSLSKKGINLFQLYSDVKAHKQKGDYTVATVFTAKGLEFTTVTLADEFTAAIDTIRTNGGIQTQEQLVTYRCAYVAASRAGKVLNNANFLKIKKV